MKLKFHRTIISMIMIIVMIAGMTQGMGGKAKAAVPGSYLLTFSTNGISGITNMPANLTIGAGSKFSIPSTIPKKSGCTFLGWSTSPSATKADPTYAPGKGDLTTNGSFTLYPVWKDSDGRIVYPIVITIKTYSGTYVGQIYIPSPRNVSVSELNSYVVNKKNRAVAAGYHRDWYDVNKKWFKSSVYVSKSTTVYYKDAPNRQTYQFIGADGKVITAASGNPYITLQTGDTFNSKIADPSVAYKVFLGWSLKKNPGPIDGLYMSDHVCFFEKDNPNEIINLYACCWDATSYSVKYRMNKTEVTNLYTAIHNLKLDIDKSDTQKIKNILSKAIPFAQKIKDVAALFLAKDIKSRLISLAVGWMLKGGESALSTKSDEYKALAKSDELMKNCKNSMGTYSEVLVTFDVKYTVPAAPNHINPTLDMGTTFMLPVAY